jgi:hypothetical protein
MTSSSPELRAACAEALGAIGDDEAIEALLSAFREESEGSVIAMGTEAASRKFREDSGEARFELFEAVWEVFDRFISTKNAVLRKQYAIAMGNILGKPGEFYPFITGEDEERAGRRKSLASRFSAKALSIFRSKAAGKSVPAGAKKAVVDCADALEAGRFREGLDAFFIASWALMRALFGERVDEQDFFEYLIRIDIRLGTWWWLLTRFEALKGGFDEEQREIVLCLLAYYLGQY